MIGFNVRWNFNNVRTDSSELEDARMNLFLPPADTFITDSFATRADNVPLVQAICFCTSVLEQVKKWPLQFCQFLLPVANAV
jgi:hypothetical protein